MGMTVRHCADVSPGQCLSSWAEKAGRPKDGNKVEGGRNRERTDLLASYVLLRASFLGLL